MGLIVVGSCNQGCQITVGIGSGLSGRVRVRVGFGLTISKYFGLSSGSFFVHHEMFYKSVWKKWENLLLSAFRDIQLNDDPNRHYCCHHPCIYIVCAFRNLVTRFVCSRYISKRISLIWTGVDWCHSHYCCVHILEVQPLSISSAKPSGKTNTCCAVFKRTVRTRLLFYRDDDNRQKDSVVPWNGGSVGNCQFRNKNLIDLLSWLFHSRIESRSYSITVWKTDT